MVQRFNRARSHTVAAGDAVPQPRFFGTVFAECDYRGRTNSGTNAAPGTRILINLY
jgi:hypothetical protein